jgi:aspartyl-tRNA(Asn)/glutamyl-tRNA(Gln) amidotransferase subunit A
MPSLDAVDAAGVFPLAPSLDHVGALARTPADAALFVSVLGGRELEPVASLEGVRVATCPDLVRVELTPEVGAALDAAVAALAALGADLVEAELPGAGEIVEAFRVLQGAEALRVHRRNGTWPGRRTEYGDDVRGRLERAEEIGLDAYLEAAHARERIRSGFERLFARADLLVSPVAASPPVRLGEEELDHLGERRPFRDLVLPFTTPHNLAGLPSCAVRAGFDGLGIPIGVQLAARPGGDGLAAGAAECLAAATPELQARRPDLP